MDPIRAALLDALRPHPRVAQQGLGQSLDDRKRLIEKLPEVVPFRGRAVHHAVGLLDWDHRLPSRGLLLRVHLLYDRDAVDRFEAAYAERMGEIAQRDLFPEFDVPDFGELPGDESYDAEVTTDLAVETMRLVSPWRREIEPEVGTAAVRTVRSSPAFARARQATPQRPPHLGDLEAVAWMPPCESGQPRWTVDVWWLTSFDGRIGKGWSFLVDTEAEVPSERIVAQREFTVRTA